MKQPKRVSDHKIHWENNRRTLNKYLKSCLITAFAVFAMANFAACQIDSDIQWLVDVLELKEGSVVADIGAGDGDQTLEIAGHIGSNGKIYSTELGSESLQELQEEISQAQVNNVTVLEGHPKRTNLPEECCDAIYMRRVYHHITDPPSFNKSLLESLKPGGRLAIIDFEPRGSEADPPGRASGNQHGVTAGTVIKELEQAGFELINSENPSGRNIYLVLEKPEPVQSTGNDEFIELFTNHFRYASRVLSLAKAMPPETYSWRPGDEVMSVEKVYAHLAYYNYFLLDRLGIEAPADLEVDKIEEMTGKEAVVDILERSIEHVNRAVKDMHPSVLDKNTQLYGRTFTGKDVLMQLITHMSEHVGQSIAYARTNGVVPPWNR